MFFGATVGRLTTNRSTAVAIAFLASVFLLFGSAGGPVAFAADPVAKDARLGGDANRTRFVTVLSKNVKFGVRTLANPYRVIIDMSDVKVNFPAGRGKKGRGLVSG